MAGSVMFLLALAPGLPFLPFALLGGILAFMAYIDPAPQSGGARPSRMPRCAKPPTSPPTKCASRSRNR